jgi:hypothetical protein
MIETLVVGAIVAAAAVYAAAKLLPSAIVAGWRMRLARRARLAGIPRVAQMLEASASAAGCGSCGTCGEGPLVATGVHPIDVSGLQRERRDRT